MNPIRQFVDAIQSGDKEACDTAFKNVFMDRVRTHLDVKSVELASSAYTIDNVQPD